MRFFFRKHEKFIFIFFDIALNGFNYLFHILVSRFITGNDYGRFNALISMASILFVTGVAFQSYMARTLAQETKNHREMHSIALNTILFSTVICVIVVLSRNSLISFLRTDFSALLIILFIFITNLFLSTGRGIFQAREQFFRLNISFYLEVLTKILLLGFFLTIGLNINRTLLTILGGMIVALFYAVIAAAPRWSRIKHSWRSFTGTKQIYTLNTTAKNILLIIAGNIFLYYFMAMDMLIVNNRLPEQAGVFAVVLRYSQLIFFAGFSLFAVLTPRLNQAAVLPSGFSRIWKKQLILIFGLIIIALSGYKWILPFTVNPLFGSKYTDAAEYLPMAGVAYSALLLIFFQVNVFIALHSKKYLIILAFLGILLPVGLIIFSHSIRQILITESILFASAVIILLVYSLFIIKHRRHL